MARPTVVKDPFALALEHFVDVLAPDALRMVEQHLKNQSVGVGEFHVTAFHRHPTRLGIDKRGLLSALDSGGCSCLGSLIKVFRPKGTKKF